MRSVRLGTGTGFSGDVLDPAVDLVERGNIDYLCFDHLAELTLANQQKMMKRAGNFFNQWGKTNRGISII